MSIDAAMTRALARRQPRSVKQVMGKSVPPKTLCVFTRQWSALLSAGIPLTQSFDLLSQSTVGSQATRKAFAITLQSLKLSVSQGESLHASFQMHPQVFGPLYCSLLQAGESAGILDKILDRLADTLEMSEALPGQNDTSPHLPHQHIGYSGLGSHGHFNLGGARVRGSVSKHGRLLAMGHPSLGQCQPAHAEVGWDVGVGLELDLHRSPKALQRIS